MSKEIKGGTIFLGKTDERFNTVYMSLKDYENIQKKLKALEIIKNNLSQEEKQVLLNTIYTYTKSEEEYDLVKEVLL